MNAASRGVRNAFRNVIRTVSIVLILGLSMGLALAMLVARQAVQDKITSVKTSIGNTVTITPAGAQGFAGGGEPLTNDELAKVAAVAHVSKVTKTLNDRLTTDNTNLASAIEPGTLGNRQAGNSGVTFMAAPDGGTRSQGGSSDQPRFTRNFTPPVIVIGTNDTTDASAFGGNTVTFTSGQAIDASKDANTAMVGKALADKNSLQTGSTFTMYGTTMTVVGVFDTGNTFANSGLIVSLPTLQRLSTQSGSVTNAVVTIDSVDNIDAVVASIKSTLGTAADVVSNQDNAKEAIAPLENVKSISLYSLVGAIAAGAIIILLTMVMIVRERRREIGVMKAIGASNSKTMLQFISEAVTLTVLGLVAGLLIGVFAANPITRVLVNNSTNSTATTAQTTTVTALGQGPGQVRRTGGGRGFGVAVRGFGNDNLASVRNIKASVGLSIIGYGIAAAIIIAIIGSALPALLLSKIRPAEVMRAE